MPVENLTLDRLLAQTEAVAGAIGDGDWQRATQLEIERRRLLESYLAAESRAHGGLEHIRGELTELQRRNNQFVGEVHHHRRRILRESDTVKRGREAASEYDRQQREGLRAERNTQQKP